MTEVRQRGPTTAVVCSEAFLKLAANQARVFGVPELPLIVIPHPLGGIDLAEVEARADRAWPQLIALLRGGLA
jgi:hypothetical protein